ncbi:MAG TPA: hypothetical protein VGX23_33605 [Actinocrinis sp.]|nr:hypothetical protein [Actinocrinis sp.]
MVQDDGILPLLPNHSDEGGRGLVIAATLAESVSYEQCAKVKRFTCTFPLEEMAA